MKSRTSSEEPDSRTSSVGRKRGLNQSSLIDASVFTIEQDSSDEDKQRNEKRPRYDTGADAGNQQVNSTTESSLDIAIISNRSGSASSLQGDESTISSEDVLTESGNNVDVHDITNNPPAWNPGVSVTIRTSLTDPTPLVHPLPSPLGVDPQISPRQDVGPAGASLSGAKTTPTKQSLDSHKIEIGSATSNHSEEEVDTRSKFELQKELERLHKIEKELATKVPRGQKEKPKSPKEEVEMENGRLSRRVETQDRTRVNILAQLPSSFGTAFCQKKAEKMINDLPGGSKDLMPRHVADNAFNFTDKGRTFKLPQRLHDVLPVIDLAKLSFRNPTHSFVGAFLEENQSLLETIDYELLVKAFQGYLGLLYGHLPDPLISLVCSSKHVVGPKSEKACLRLLDERRQKTLRIPELEEAHSEQIQHTQARLAERVEKEAEKAELKTIHAQLAEVKKALKLLREAKLEDKRVKQEAEKAKKESGEAENKSNRNDLKNYVASRQFGPENPGSCSADELTTFDGRSSEMAQILQNLKPYSMGRLLGVKRAHSLATRFTTTGSTKNYMGEPFPERKLICNQQPHLETISGILVQASDQVDAEQIIASSRPTSLKLIRRYLPSSEEPSIVRFCLSCARTDHEASECPSLTCVSCGLQGVHFIDACPKRQRCSKCYERGHQKSDCPEKLAATADENLRCNICSSNKHVESACHFLWRSFKHSMTYTTKVVADIPIHCYCCGAAGHFGSECGIRNSPLHTEGYSWSMINWKRYVDPQSHNRAPAAGKDFSLPGSRMGKKSFNIRGSAQNGIVTPIDDDENIPFIRERVAKPTRPVRRGNQHIKFDQIRQGDKEYGPRSNLEPPQPISRHQPYRAARPAPQQGTYAGDRHEFSSGPRNDSARYMRERSFSPPPRFNDERYPPRPGDNYHRTDETFDTYRPYDRTIGNSKTAPKAPAGRGNHNKGPARGGLARGGHGGVVVPQGKRQRNRKS